MVSALGVTTSGGITTAGGTANGSTAPPPPQPAINAVIENKAAVASDLIDVLIETTFGPFLALKFTHIRKTKPARNQYVIRNF